MSILEDTPLPILRPNVVQYHLKGDIRLMASVQLQPESQSCGHGNQLAPGPIKHLSLWKLWAEVPWNNDFLG